MEGSARVNQIPNELAVKRSKFLWRVAIIFNFAVGAYIFAQSGRRERRKHKVEVPAEVASTPAAATTLSAAPVLAQEEPVISPPITRPVTVRQPIPEDQQLEIFKWMLEEKRKVKPQNREEKKRIDEEKGILKVFIRSKTVPRI